MMNVSRILCRLLIGVVGSPVLVFGQTPASNMVKITDGTVVPITLTEDLNSGRVHQNDPVHGQIGEDLKVSGVVVIAKGAPVVGHVTQAEPKGR